MKSDRWRIVRREVGLSGRPHPLSSRVREGGFAESGRVRHFDRLTENRVWNVLVTVVDTRMGDAGVSGRVREGVLAPS